MITNVIKQNRFTEEEVRSIMVPRLNEEEKRIPGENSEYLHWMSLIMLLKDAHPEASVESEVITDTPDAVTVRVSVWLEPSAEKPAASANYKQRYTDDVCDTFTACQSMALRLALIWSGIGTNYVLEDEIARRNSKLKSDEAEAEKLKEEAAPMSSGEMFNALQKKISERKGKEQACEEPEPVTPSKEPEDIQYNPFEEAGIAAPEETAAEPAESAEEPEEAPEAPEAKAQAEAKESESETETAEENVPSEAPQEESSDDADSADPDDEAPACEEPDYIIQDGDFTRAKYNKKYTGQRLSDLSDDTLRVIVNNSSIMTEEFQKKIKKYLG